MRVKVQVEIDAFRVPEFVTVTHEPLGSYVFVSDERKFKLSELDVETLEKLCRDFTYAVFEKSGHRPPLLDWS